MQHLKFSLQFRQILPRRVPRRQDTTRHLSSLRNLFYANAGRLVEDVRTLATTAPDPLRLFVLDGSEIHSLDWTSAEALRKCIELVHGAGAQFTVARLPHEARDLLDYHGITEALGGEAGYIDTVTRALLEFQGRD